MPTIQVTEILERAKSASDMRDNFVTTTEWLRWLNVEYKMLENYILRHGYALRESREDITANGAESYDIEDPMVVLGVYELMSSGRQRRLRHSDVMDGAGHVYFSTAGPTGSASTFNIIQAGDNEVKIRFHPRPASGTYQVYIISEPVALAIDDEVQYPAGLEERLVLGLARRAVAKEEGDTRELSRQIREFDAHIESFCFDRVMAGHQQVRNVDKVERGWADRAGTPDPADWIWR